MGPDLDPMNLMVNISAEYPLMFNFLLVLTAIVGFGMTAWVLMVLCQVHVFQTVSKDRFNWGLAIPALLISSSLMAFTTTLYMVSGSLLDAGAGSLFPPSAIQDGLTADKLMGMFAEQTVRMLGYIFGFWGFVEMFVSRMPDRDKTMFWGGVIRLGAGVILIRARDFGNLFGGMGDVFFR